jgi:hypothetical protein
MIGTSGASRSIDAWQQVYRSLEHGFAKNQCTDKKVMPRFPIDVQDFANVFVTLQDRRHDADYDPLSRFSKSDVVADIDRAETAIITFNAVVPRDRRAFCAWVLLKKRG